jgi:hypothetical protein
MAESDDTMGRISAAVKAYEAGSSNRLDLAPPNEQYNEDQPMRWMCLTEDLAAAGSTILYGSTYITIPTVATANPIDWQLTANSGKGGYVVDTTLIYYVQEATGQNSYKSGQWLLCRPIMTAGGAAWEPITPQAGLAYTAMNGFSGPVAYAIPGPTSVFSPVTIPDNSAYLVLATMAVGQNFSGSVTAAEPDAIDVGINQPTGTVSYVGSWGNNTMARVGYTTVPTYTATTVLSDPGVLDDTATTTLTPTWNYQDMGIRTMSGSWFIPRGQKGNTFGLSISGTAVNGSGNSVKITAQITFVKIPYFDNF